MKKLILTLPLLASSAAFANNTPETTVEYDGFRVGGGIINGEVEGQLAPFFSDDNGLGVEVGYDFNKVIGVSGTIGNSGDISATQFALDLGYAFNLGSNHYIKPYVDLGYSMYDAGDIGDESGMTTGFGIRYTAPFGLYVDLSQITGTVDSTVWVNDGYNTYYQDGETDLVQTSLVVGYKF